MKERFPEILLTQAKRRIYTGCEPPERANEMRTLPMLFP